MKNQKCLGRSSRGSCLCVLVICIVSSSGALLVLFLQRQSVWISLIVAGISFQASKSG